MWHNFWTTWWLLGDYLVTISATLPCGGRRMEFFFSLKIFLPYMQKAGDCWDISPQFFLDFPQNFRLRTRNQYCTQAIAWGSTILDGGSTILDGGSTILDGSSTIFCRFSPFFVDFHHFLSIFTIYALLSRFTFCRDLRTFSANFFGQNSLLRNITRFLHVWC